MSFSDEARAYHEDHQNCAQSVFLTFAKRMDMDGDVALRLAALFGGGMGHNGQVCGAVSGSLMAIGLARGYDIYDADKKAASYEMARDFQNRFVELHGDLTCPGLLGLDIGDPEQLEEAREEDLFHTICPVFIGDAARIVGEILDLSE